MPAAPLLELSASHAAFAGGRCDAVTFAPTAASATRLRGLGIIAKAAPGRIALFAMVDGDRRPIINPPRSLTMDFAMRADMARLAPVTELGAITDRPAPLFRNQIGSAGAGSDDLILDSQEQQAEEIVETRSPSVAEHFVLGGSPRAGTTASDFTVANGAAAVTSYEPAMRRITLDTQALASGALIALSYPVVPRRAPDVLAVARISLDIRADAPLPARPRRFVVPLVPRSAFWAYYLVTKDAGPLDRFTIADRSGAGPAIAFPAAGRTDLSAGNDPADPVGQSLVGRFPAPAARVIRFLSDAAVPCRSGPARRLDLQVGDAVRHANLPNPAPTSIGVATVGGAKAQTRTAAIFDTD